MYRSPALTYFDVADAAQELLLKGVNPTQEALKAILKRGSTTTIAKYLKRWRVEQGGGTQLAIKENLPPEVVAAVQTVWETLIEKADQKIKHIQADADAKIDELEITVDTTENNLAEIQQRYVELQTRHEKVLNEKRVAELTIQQQQTDLITSHTKLNAQTEQLTEKQNRIDELNRLHHQVQANLEHYRENAREQRLQDQQRHEQVQTELEQTIKSLRSELMIAQQNNMLLQVESEKINLDLSRQQQKNNEILQQNQKLTENITNKEKQIIQIEFSNTQFENMLASLNLKFEQQSIAYNEDKKQIAVLTQQLSDANDSNRKLEQQNEQLSGEKWQFLQQNSLLLAQKNLLREKENEY